MLLAAVCAAGGRLAFGHEDAPADLVRVAGNAASANSIAAASLCLAGILLWLTIRLMRSRATAQSLRPNLLWSRIAAATIFVLWVWALPWLSLHETHHLMDNGDETCPVAQVAHSQAGGVLQATPVLTLPSVVFALVPQEPVAAVSCIVPEPAARSPPV
jgi:uncharacterized membrane protein YjfL (UPF0719 family)